MEKYPNRDMGDVEKVWKTEKEGRWKKIVGAMCKLGLGLEPITCLCNVHVGAWARTHNLPFHKVNLFFAMDTAMVIAHVSAHHM